MGGLPRVRTPSSGQCRVLQIGRRVGNERRDPGLRLGRDSDVEVGAEGLGHVLLEEPARGLARDAAHDLADQVPLGDRVVPRLGTRLPPRRLARQQLGAAIPVGEIFDGQRLLPTAEAGSVTEQVAYLDLVLAGGAELRPVPGDGRMEVQLAAIGQHQRAQGDHGLGGREDVDERVALPRPGARRILVAAPDVDNRLAIDEDRHRRTDVEALVDVAPEGLGHGAEAVLVFTIDLGHERTPYPRCSPVGGAAQRRPAKSTAFMPGGPMPAYEVAQRYETVVLYRDAAAARIELNRPETMNAWNEQLGHDLLGAITAVTNDPEVRAVELSGAGRGFSSGADLRGGFDLTPEGKPDVQRRLRELYHPIIVGVRRMPKPVVAAVNGPAVGIGCSLALAADLILAARSAYFLLAFVNIGLVPDGGSSVFVPARIGLARAAEMAMLGERVSSEQALQWGLVNRVVDDEQLAAEAGALMDRLAAGPTLSYAGAKRQFNARVFAGMEEQLELEAQIQQQQAATDDFAEGVAAFVEKREARFQGR